MIDFLLNHWDWYIGIGVIVVSSRIWSNWEYYEKELKDGSNYSCTNISALIVAVTIVAMFWPIFLLSILTKETK